MIGFNLEQFSLNIKTDSTPESNAKVEVYFYNRQGQNVGELALDFHSPPKYYIRGCTSGSTYFPTATEKVWRVTLTRTSGIRQLVVHCNEVEVLNTLTLDVACVQGIWSTYWSGVTGIQFTYSDTASDFYKHVKPGNCVI